MSVTLSFLRIFTNHGIMEWFVTFASIPKCESLACDHCTSPPWLPQQHRWEAGLQNHCLHYTARWKLSFTLKHRQKLQSV